MKFAYVLASVIAFTIASMYGCTDVQVQYVPIDLSARLDPKPLLPKVKKEELSCLTDATYNKIMERQTLLIESDLRCRNLVNSTRKQDEKAEK